MERQTMEGSVRGGAVGDLLDLVFVFKPCETAESKSQQPPFSNPLQVVQNRPWHRRRRQSPLTRRGKCGYRITSSYPAMKASLGPPNLRSRTVTAALITLGFSLGVNLSLLLANPAGEQSPPENGKIENDGGITKGGKIETDGGITKGGSGTSLRANQLKNAIKADLRRVSADQAKLKADQDKMDAMKSQLAEAQNGMKGNQQKIAAAQQKFAAAQQKFATDKITLKADQDKLAADQQKANVAGP
jgi:hypothetical protein